LLVATGIASVVAQLLLIREFLALFRGNEYIIALLLFNWLILGGIGTRLARLVAGRTASRANLAWISLALAVLGIVQIPAIRQLRDLVFIHGSSVGFYPTFLFILVGMAPYCLLVGFALPYCLFVLRSETPGYSGVKVYMADNLGDVSGGALFSFFLVWLVTPLQALFLAGLPLVVCAVLLFLPGAPNRLRWLIAGGLVLVTMAGVLGLERASLLRPAGELVHYQESRYGRLEVYRDREQFTLFRDGVPAGSDQNRSRAEEAVHYPLAQLDWVRRILLIAPESGMLQEVAKYRPELVDYVELDPAITTLQFRYGMVREIPGLNLIHQDARAWLNTTNQTYDAIIMSLPEPETFQVNRFFTTGFFATVQRHLAPGGVFSFTLEGYDNFLGAAQRNKVSSVYNTAALYFSDILLLPGASIHFLCRDRPMSAEIPGRLADRGIATWYVGNFFAGDITPERVAYLRGELEPAAPLNTDLQPQLMRLMFLQWFAQFQTTPFWFYGLLGLLLVVYLLRARREEYVLFSTGFMVMGSEILVIFAFQVYYGYIYTQIGLIVTVFLAGLLPGAWLGERLASRPARVMVWIDLSLILLLGLFWLLLVRVGEGMTVEFLLLFGFLVSFGCGMQFAPALRMGGGDSPAATRVFSADLLGAAAGALLTSVVLIPFLGIAMTTMVLALIKTTSLILVSRA
jgi:spermidine synthase